MASVYSESRARTMKSYITSENFFNYLRTYQTQQNSTTFATEGRLTTPGTVAGVTTVPIVNVKTKVNLLLADCPAGRILRETGRRLYPGQNPGLNVGDKYNGAVVGTNATQTMWVMVYDVMTGISAFINPNDTVFSVYSSDKPLELIHPLEGSTSVLGQPVITGGVVSSVSSITSSLTCSGSIVTAAQIRSTGLMNLTPLIVSNAVTLDPTVSQYFAVNPGANPLTIYASSIPVGALIRILVTYTAGQVVTFDGSSFSGAFNHTIPVNTTSLVNNSVQTSATPGGQYLLTFISDGSKFFEVSRNGPLA